MFDNFYRISSERIGIVFFVICSMVVVFLTPPFQVPDEPNHMIRAYQISEGSFTCYHTSFPDFPQQFINGFSKVVGHTFS